MTMPLSPENWFRVSVLLYTRLARGSGYLFLLIGGENGYLLVSDVGPHHELLFPLHHRDSADKGRGK